MKEAWVLRLKSESKEEDMTGDYYFDNDGDEMDWVTRDLNEATVFMDKDAAIENFKTYEKAVFEKFGKDSICNFGWTNISKNFDFVEVEVSEVD